MTIVIPQHTKEALDRYINHGLDTGSFLKAVLTNDLFGAISRADNENAYALKDICQYIYNNTPSPCHGSVENYNNWIESKRSVAQLTNV